MIFKCLETQRSHLFNSYCLQLKIMVLCPRTTYFCFLFGVVLFLTACLKDESYVEEKDFKTAQIEQLSQEFLNEVSLAQHSLTNSNSWKLGTLDVSATVEISVSNQKTNVFYCVNDPDDPTKVMLLSWLNDHHGSFIDIDSERSQTLLTRMAKQTTLNSLGIYKNGRLDLRDGSLINIPTHCGFNIPQYAPVYVTHMDVPKSAQDVIVKQEFMTTQCPDGQVGHVINMAEVRINHVEGVTERSEWVEHLNNCRDKINTSAIDIVEVTGEGGDYAALAAGATSSVTLGALSDNLGDYNCREAQQVVDNNDDNDGIDLLEGDNTADGYSTCGYAGAPRAIGAINTEREITLETHSETRACEGWTGTYTDIVEGVSGEITVPQWTGEGVYERDVETHVVMNDDGLEDILQYRTSWRGISLYCQREETFYASCREAYPEYNNDRFEILHNGGFTYHRTRTVEGWQDPLVGIANPEEVSDWVMDPASSGCRWREVDDRLRSCSDGSWGYTTARSRIIEIDTDFNLEISDWQDGPCVSAAFAREGGRASCGMWGNNSDRNAAMNDVTPARFDGISGGWRRCEVGHCESDGVAAGNAYQYEWVPFGQLGFLHCFSL